jgi:hypothetical protein
MLHGAPRLWQARKHGARQQRGIRAAPAVEVVGAGGVDHCGLRSGRGLHLS